MILHTIGVSSFVDTLMYNLVVVVVILIVISVVIVIIQIVVVVVVVVVVVTKVTFQHTSRQDIQRRSMTTRCPGLGILECISHINTTSVVL